MLFSRMVNIWVIFCLVTFARHGWSFTPEIYVTLDNVTADGTGGRVVVSRVEMTDTGMFDMVQGTVCADNSWDDAAASAVCRQVSLAFGSDPDESWDGGIATEPGEFGPGGRDDPVDEESSSDAGDGSDWEAEDSVADKGDAAARTQRARARRVRSGSATNRVRRLRQRQQPTTQRLRGARHLLSSSTVGSRARRLAGVSRRGVAVRRSARDVPEGGSYGDVEVFPQPVTPILMSNVMCHGDEWLLGACSFTWLPSGCNHSQDAGVWCYRNTPPQPKPGDPALLRLASSFPYRVEENMGRLEVFGLPSLGWVSVCGTGMGAAEAHVACRQLGFQNGSVLDDPFVFFFQETTFRPIRVKKVTCTGNEDHLSDCNIEMVDPRAYSGDPNTQGKLCPLPAWAIEDGEGEGGGLSPDSPQLTRRGLRSTELSSAPTHPTHERWSREQYRRMLARDASTADVEELVRQYLSFARTGEAAPAAASQALGPAPPKTLLEQALTQKFVATRAAWTRGRSRTAMSTGGDDFFLPDIQAVLICFDPPPLPPSTPEVPETPETSPPPPSTPDAPESPEASPHPSPPDESSMPYIPPPPPDYPPPAPPPPPVYGHNGDGIEVVDGAKKGSGDQDSGSGSYVTGSDSSSGKIVAAAPEDIVEDISGVEGSSADTGSGEGSSAGTGSGEGSSAGTGSGEGSSAGTGSGEGSSADVDGADVEATEGGDVTPEQGSGSGEA